MLKIELYLKSTNALVGLLETDDQTTIGFTVNNLDFNNPSTQRVSYSNSFRIPRTPRNEGAFGKMLVYFTNKSTQSSPYTAYYVKLNYNQMYLGNKYSIRLDSYSDGYIQISMTAYKDIFDELKKPIDDMLKAVSYAPKGKNYIDLGDKQVGDVMRADTYSSTPGWIMPFIFNKNKNNNLINYNQNSQLTIDHTATGISIKQFITYITLAFNITVTYPSSFETYMNTHYLLLPSASPVRDTTLNKLFIKSCISESENKGYVWFKQSVKVIDVLKEVCKMNMLFLYDITKSTDTNFHLEIATWYDGQAKRQLVLDNFQVRSRKFKLDQQGINNYVKVKVDSGQSPYYGATLIPSNNLNLEKNVDIMTLNVFHPTMLAIDTIFYDDFYCFDYNVEPKSSTTDTTHDDIPDQLQIFKAVDTTRTGQVVSTYLTNNLSSAYKVTTMVVYQLPDKQFTFLADVLNNTDILEVNALLPYYRLLTPTGLIRQQNTVAVINDEKYFINKISNITVSPTVNATLELIKLDTTI
jgi:hypothetical protein